MIDVAMKGTGIMPHDYYQRFYKAWFKEMGHRSFTIWYKLKND